MKRHARVWKWVLGLAGGMALAIGILVGDAYRKAGAVFERHEADVSRVLAEVRERDFVRPPLFGEGIPGNAFDDYRSALQNLKGPPTVGGSEIRLLRNGLSRRIADPGDEIMSPTSLSWPRVYAYLAGLSYLSQAAAQAHRRGNDHHAVEMVVLLFGAAQDTIGRGVPELASLGRVELEAVEVAQTLLFEHTLDGPELEDFARRLDRLEETRPRISRAMELASALDRREILEIELGRRNPKDRPEIQATWKDLFSARLARARRLEEIAEHYARLKDLEKLPMPDRAVQGNLIGRPGVPFEGRWGSYAAERDALRGRLLLRMAVAVAWFEAEKETFPETLGDLVPRYLPRIPDDPATGRPVEGEGGTIGNLGTDGGWTVKRK